MKNTVKGMACGEQYLGELRETPEKSRERAYYLRCIFFLGLFLAVISCLLCEIFTVSVQDMFILVGGQNIAVEANLVNVPGIWIWPRFHAFWDIIRARNLCLHRSVLRAFWEKAVLLMITVCILISIDMFF